MRGRAELHFHLLPGVDDGPATMEESFELARLAVQDGTTTVVTTPHVCDVVPAELPARVEELARRLAEEAVALEVRCGGEIAYGDVPSLTPEDLRVMASGPSDAPWVLLEAPLPQTGAAAEDLLGAAEAIRAEGYAVLLGHPERSAAMFDDGTAGLLTELAAGSVPQINATSLLGANGEEARQRGLWLAATWPNAVVASDAHGPLRGPSLTAATDALVRAGVPEAVARELTGAGPRRLLEQGIAPAPVTPRPRAPAWPAAARR